MGLPLSVVFRTLNWEEIRRELEEVSPLFEGSPSIAV